MTVGQLILCGDGNAVRAVCSSGALSSHLAHLPRPMLEV